MEKASEDVLARLSENHQLALITTEGGDGVPSFYNKVWELPSRRPGRYSLQWWMLLCTRRKSWRAWHPDVVFSVSTAGGPFARFCFGAPILAQLHGLALTETLSALRGGWSVGRACLQLSRIPREILLIAQSDGLVTVGPSVTSVVGGAPYLRKTVAEIPNGIDMGHMFFSTSLRDSLRLALNIPTDADVVCFVGRLHEQKGPDIALRAAVEAGTFAIFAGDGPVLNELMKLAHELGASDRVFFLGYVPSSEIAQVLSAADVFLFMPRRIEGLPLNVLEALSAGLPVLTNKCASLPQALAVEVHLGEHFSGDYSRALKKILKSLDKTRRESALPEAYSLDSTAQQYEARLNEIVTEWARPHSARRWRLRYHAINWGLRPRAKTKGRPDEID